MFQANIGEIVQNFFLNGRGGIISDLYFAFVTGPPEGNPILTEIALRIDLPDTPVVPMPLLFGLTTSGRGLLSLYCLFGHYYIIND